MAVLRWCLAALLLGALIVSVGAVMAYVYGGASGVTLVVAASVAVLSWHALRRLEPRGDGPFEEPPVAESLALTGLLGVVIILGIWYLPAGLAGLLALYLACRFWAADPGVEPGDDHVDDRTG